MIADTPAGRMALVDALLWDTVVDEDGAVHRYPTGIDLTAEQVLHVLETGELTAEVGE